MCSADVSSMTEGTRLQRAQSEAARIIQFAQHERTEPDRKQCGGRVPLDRETGSGPAGDTLEGGFGRFSDGWALIFVCDFFQFGSGLRCSRTPLGNCFRRIQAGLLIGVRQATQQDRQNPFGNRIVARMQSATTPKRPPRNQTIGRLPFSSRAAGSRLWLPDRFREAHTAHFLARVCRRSKWLRRVFRWQEQPPGQLPRG